MIIIIMIIIPAQNNAIKAYYIEAKIDNTQENSKYRLCGNKDEIFDHISKCSKLGKGTIWLDTTGQGTDPQGIVQETEI